MDILKDFKNFFYSGGLDALIHRFRNPTELEDLMFGTEYNSATDARESYNSELEDTAMNPKSVKPFSIWLNHQFDALKNGLKSRCENLVLIHKDDKEEFVKNTFNESDIDFAALRQKILMDKNLLRYHEDLLLFVTDIEGIFKKSKQTLLHKDNIKRIKKKNEIGNVRVSFGFKGKNKILEKLHSELVRHDFIDVENTSKKVFIDLLTANNFHDVTGDVQFKCQTRQAAYIITQLTRLSINPELQFFADSGKFKNKKGEPLSATNIYKSVSPSNNKPIASKEDIDEIFRNLMND